MPSKCSYINCNLSYYNRPEGIRLYKFPSDDRAMQWIINSGNLSLLKLPTKSLRRRVICQRHFTEDSFVIGCRNYRLNTLAVPVKHAETQIPPQDPHSSVQSGTGTPNTDGTYSSENVDNVSDVHLTTQDIIQYTNNSSRNIHAEAVIYFEKVLSYVESQNEATPADILCLKRWMDIANTKSITFLDQKSRQSTFRRMKFTSKGSEEGYAEEQGNMEKSQGLGDTIYIKQEPLTELENEMKGVVEVFPEHFLSNIQSSAQFNVIKQEPDDAITERDVGF